MALILLMRLLHKPYYSRSSPEFMAVHSFSLQVRSVHQHLNFKTLSSESVQSLFRVCSESVQNLKFRYLRYLPCAADRSVRLQARCSTYRTYQYYKLSDRFIFNPTNSMQSHHLCAARERWTPVEQCRSRRTGSSRAKNVELICVKGYQTTSACKL